MAGVGPRIAGMVVALLVATGCTELGSASTSPGAPSISYPTAPPGFPVGTYSKEISAADFARAGVEDANVGNNTGRFTLTLSPDGRWTSVQEALEGEAQVNPIARGHYVADASTIAITTEYPTEYAGATSHFSWRLDGSSLWMTIVDSPDPLEIKLAKAMDAEPWVPVP